MKKANPILGVAVALAALNGGCATSDEAPVKADQKSLTVQTVQVLEADLPLVVTAVGTTEPYARASPSTRLMGRIATTAFEEGDVVGRDQEMVRIEDRDLRAQRQQALSGLDEAKAIRTNAEKNLRRMQNLFAQEAVPQQKLDEAETGYARAQAGVAAAQQAVKGVEVDLDYSTIKSPLSGVVVRKFVQAGDMAAPGAPLFTVEQQDSIKVVVMVGERDQALVRPGAKVAVEIEALQQAVPGLEYGRVEALIPAADTGSRSFQVKVVVPNPQGHLKTGMFARVHFAKGRRPGLLVPAQAIVQHGQLKGVYIVRQGRARLRWVRLGKTWKNGIEVLSGLNSGAQVITTGADQVKDGQPVEVDNDA